jgi:hypothetical protein
MKTILISDIKGKYESIIPYGLNFAKFADDKIKVIHAIDRRTHKAVSSSYADSQTIEVGEKLSSDAIINREIDNAQKDLNKLLSHEASRLNYPLRVTVSVTENSLEKQLKQELKQEDNALIISSAQPDETLIDELEEFFSLTESYRNYSLLIPPGSKFKKPDKAFILYDFNIKEDRHIFSLLKFLSNYKLSVNVADVSLKKDYFEMEMKSELWQQVAINHNRSANIRITTNILEGDNYLQTIIKYIKRNEFDLIVVSRKNPKILNKNIFSRSGINQIIEALNIPVLIY